MLEALTCSGKIVDQRLVSGGPPVELDPQRPRIDLLGAFNHLKKPLNVIRSWLFSSVSRADDWSPLRGTWIIDQWLYVAAPTTGRSRQPCCQLQHETHDHRSDAPCRCPDRPLGDPLVQRHHVQDHNGFYRGNRVRLRAFLQQVPEPTVPALAPAAPPISQARRSSGGQSRLILKLALRQHRFYCAPSTFRSSKMASTRSKLSATAHRTPTISTTYWSAR